MTTWPSPSERRPSSIPPLELWGGIECTVNRVGDRYFDQIALSGHDGRLEDLDRFAELGIRTLRYPVLWERVAPDGIDRANWTPTDKALTRLRELGIKPIVGLLHHGSGPRYTSLIDSEFSQKLADFARAVAERYPWVDCVTPVNEPLTTARFSALYGLWYPHARDDRTFVRALLNQILGIRSAMAAFRTVNPQAKLIQTEDLGKTYATPARSYQAVFENNRRWLTFDLLAGRVDERHSLWRYLLQNGADPDVLRSLIQRPSVPDVLGINHYLTGERFLDERTELYPPPVLGGNGRHTYADVEAVRVLENGIAGHLGLVGEAWQRYRLPIAITEVHLGCTREHQMRWLDEAWQSARQLRGEGCDIRAVTVWSLLGSYDWDSLLTQENRSYEPGAFDVRSPVPRLTALGEMATRLATANGFDHPALDGEGWWREPQRISYSAVRVATSPRSLKRTIDHRRPIMLVGARGTLGRAFTRICHERGLEVRSLSRSELDITDPTAIETRLAEIKPWAVINAAGYVRVDDAEWDVASCQRLNAESAVCLGQACDAAGIHYTTFSSDLVFDGSSERPYVESDRTRPLGVYGASKADAENRLLALMRKPLIVRTSAFFGPWDAHNFLTTTLDTLSVGGRVDAADDTVVSPTYVPDLVNAVLDLVIDGERGIWHLANSGETTWAEFARCAARLAGMDTDLVTGVPMSDLNPAARRPQYSVLGSERGLLMPSLEDAIARYLSERPRSAPLAQTVSV